MGQVKWMIILWIPHHSMHAKGLSSFSKNSIFMSLQFFRLFLLRRTEAISEVYQWSSNVLHHNAFVQNVHIEQSQLKNLISLFKDVMQ
jgi:hypothetical protein